MTKESSVLLKRNWLIYYVDYVGFQQQNKILTRAPNKRSTEDKSKIVFLTSRQKHDSLPNSPLPITKKNLS